jgi:hypothetical protein
MEKRRRLFLVALLVFAGWVISLGVLAVVSGRKPPPAAVPKAVNRAPVSSATALLNQA